MKNFKDQNKTRRFFESWPILFILSIILIVFIYSMFTFLGKMKDTTLNKQIVENKILELEKNKQKLELDIQNLETNSGIEENIRENFGLIKEGEGLVVVIEDKNKIETTVETNFWDRIKSYFR